ncbi:amidohydrolase [Rhizocola hellebori]|nr:amidohydrolase [Rhizocola hellebori]
MPATVYENGHIHTLDPGLPVAEAIAVRGERIVATGDVASCRAAAGAGAARVDLAGLIVLPGFTDAHIHSASYARRLHQVDLRGATSLAQCLERIAAAAAVSTSDDWLLGGGWDFNRWDNPVQPTRHDLDVVCAHRPVALPSIDGHTTWVNTLALRLLNIDAGTPEMPGGQIVRDADGLPTGILREAAAAGVRQVQQEVGAADLAGQLAVAQRRLLSVGLTSIHDIDGVDCRMAYETLYAQGDLALRVHKLIPVTALDEALERGRATGDGDSWLRTGAMKIFMDGALGSHTCLTTKALADSPGNHGIAVTGAQEAYDLLARAATGGIAIAAHAIGDAANAMVLDAFERWQATGCAPGLRHRIEHAQHQRPADIARFARLGVIASMQPIHCTSDIDLVETLLAGHEVASYPWRSLLAAGATVVFGSDAPVEDPNPFHGLHAAVTRQRAEGTPQGGFQPHERLTIAQAVRAYTVTPAYASGEEGSKGVLRRGMLADFIAVSTDPFTADPAALRDIEVDLTVVGGVIRWQR